MQEEEEQEGQEEVQEEGEAEGKVVMNRARWIAGAGFGTAAAFAAGGTAQAADFTVTSLADDGSDGTLRKEIADALTAGAGNRIVFQSALSGTITMSGTQMVIDKALEIQGPGANVITVDANYLSRHFNVDVTPTSAAVTISGLSLVNGHAADPTPPPALSPEGGGSINNHDSRFTLDGVVLRNNYFTPGGGAFYDRGGSGAGQNTVIRNSTITGNTAAYWGGGIAAYDEVGLIENTTIADNVAAGGQGGAMNTSGTPTIVSSTITGNSAPSTTAGRGGGIYNRSAPPVLIGTIVADNTNGVLSSGNMTSPDIATPTNTVQAQFSLIKRVTGATITHTIPGSNITGTGNTPGLDPVLGPLQDNGGPTPTRKPGVTSPVIDKGRAVTPNPLNPTAFLPLDRDQRGEIRPFDAPSFPDGAADASDMGAVELQLTDVPQAPVGAFTVDPVQVVAGEPVTFDASGSSDADGTVEAYAWDLDAGSEFNDGTDVSVEHTFTEPGETTVRLRVTDDIGLTDIETQDVDVLERPSAAFSFDPPAPVPGETITLVSTSADDDGTVDLTEWDLDGDGEFDDDTGTESEVSFPDVGAHTVGVRVTDDDGLTEEATQAITVVAAVPPEASFGFSPAQPGPGEVINLTSTSTDADGTIETLEWDLDGDGGYDDATGEAASTAFPAAGTHTVGLQVTDNDGETDSAQQAITVIAPTVPPPPPPPPARPAFNLKAELKKCKKKKSKKAKKKCKKKAKKKAKAA
jgi:PKD repeat protein